jgi:fused
VPYQVYKGRKRYTGQMAALKFINKKGKGAKEVTSLRQEMNILCTLEHENIIRWLEHFETDTDFVVVTELAQGALLTLRMPNWPRQSLSLSRRRC